MSAAAGAPSSPVRTYGGWRRPASPGIGPLRLIPTITVLVSLAVLVLVAMIAGFLPAVVLALLLSLVGTRGSPASLETALAPCLDCWHRCRCGRRRMPSAASTAWSRSRRPSNGL